MGTLRFARELARFEEYLDWVSRGGGGGYRTEGSVVAASFKQLIGDLADLDDCLGEIQLPADFPSLQEILVRAMAANNRASTELREEYAAERENRQAEYAEAERRHELAVNVECPFCGAAPGDVCRSSGQHGKRQGKGIHDHKDRYRAATDPEWKARAVVAKPAHSSEEADLNGDNTTSRRCKGFSVNKGRACRVWTPEADFCPSHLHPSGFPDDFLATDEMLDRVANTCPDVDAEAETARFRQYWQIKRQSYAPDPADLDWSAEWFAWMSDAQQAVEGRFIAGPYGYSKQPGTYQFIASSIVGCR